MKNLKFHLIAIAAISLIVMGLYSVMGRQNGTPQAATPQPGERQVTVYAATWGANCNAEMDRLEAERAAAPVGTDRSGQPVAPQKFTRVSPDNVLERVGSLCNQRYECHLRADVETLGFDPIAACYKDLVVTYRCFEFDRPNTLTVPQGATLDIDCRSNEAPH